MTSLSTVKAAALGWLEHPLLSKRRNIVVIDGYARHLHDALPNASFIGFTGTPVELTDASTRRAHALEQRPPQRGGNSG